MAGVRILHFAALLNNWRNPRRDKVFATVLAIVTLLAVPPALLLAFFALNGGVQNSLRNVSGHAAVYAVVWGPFVALIIGAWIARRFFKPRPPRP